MNKKIIAGLATIAVVATIATGVTVAYFNDVESSTGNSITAGNMNLQLQCPGQTITDMSPLYPETGTDTTGYPGVNGSGTGSYNLNSTDIAKLSASDDSRYVSKYAWYNTFTDPTEGSDTPSHPLEYLNFGMTNIPSGATVTGASLKIEWQRGNGITAARIKVYDGSTWQVIPLTLPTANIDYEQTINLYGYGFTTKDKIDALKIQFQATQSGTYDPNDSASKTAIDLVRVDATYTTTSSPFWCDNGLLGTFTVTNIKPGDSAVQNPATIYYHNEGNVSGTLKVKAEIVADDENNCNSAEIAAGDATCGTTGGGELSQFLHLYINGVDAGTLQTLTTTPYVIGSLAGGASSSLSLAWELPSGTGNLPQGDGVNFTVDFVLDQI